MKREIRQRPKKILPQPVSPPADIAGAIPVELQIFVGKTPAEFLKEFFTHDQSEKFVGMMSAFGSDLGISVPEFAKAASKQFWKYFLRGGFDPQNSMKDFGVLTKFIDLDIETKPTRKKTSFEVVMSKALPILMKLLEKEMSTLSDKDKAEYYTGRIHGVGVIEKMKAPDYLKMIKRAPIYLIISCLWRLFESFQSQAEAERWLRSEKIIGKNVQSSEVRAVLRNVGLRYRKQGRPKKQKTHVAN